MLLNTDDTHNLENQGNEVINDFSLEQFPLRNQELLPSLLMWQKTKEVQLTVLFTEKGKEKMLEKKIHTVDDIITNYLNFDRNLDITVPLRQ